MKTDENCVFCKIVSGDIPSQKVFEDNDFLAFLDIEPVSDGHLLIIPKEHVVWMNEASDEIVAGSFVVAKKLMNALKKGLGYDYVTVSVSGTDVPHFHIHLIPRIYKDGLTNWPTKSYQDGEAEVLVEKITAAL